MSSHHRHCLSAEPHINNIKEYLLHFLGCIEISDRSRFLNDELHDVWLFDIQHHIDSGKSEDEARAASKEKREKWKTGCLSELRRIEFLRAKLEADPEESQLVSDLVDSRKKWRASQQFDERIDKIAEWKRRPEYASYLEESSRHWTSSDEYKKCVELREKLKDKTECNGTPGTNDSISDNQPRSLGEDYIPERDVNVPIVQFKDGNPADFTSSDVDDRKVWGTFPDQKTTVEHLLDRTMGENNILCREKTEKNTIKYFHLPSNNMTWAEEAVARYFNEDRPEFYKIRRKVGAAKKTQSAMVLKESHWRGQLHGGRQSVNSRYMRPFCEALSSSVTDVDHVPKDITLFMPYLHWETSRNRERFSQKIEEIVDKHHSKVEDNEVEDRENRRMSRKFLHPESNAQSGAQSSKKPWYLQTKDMMTTCFTGSNPDSVIHPQPSQPERPANRQSPATTGRIPTLGALAQHYGYPKNPVKVDKKGRLLVVYENEDKQWKGSPLGQYLIDAARMFEAITNYRDKRLLETFLMNEPPLHPRRTLDQAYYWILDTTRVRDKDQVVYRATTAKGADFHKYDLKKEAWPKHDELKIEGPCRDCSQKIKKVSRVVMVDQLWMWILDANTIITCFPKRYGTNKHDASGVHKSVRTRIGDKRHQQVKSVFDLALIIFEECSNTFFDRTRTTDKQPQVLDAFSEAIGNIMHKHTLAFERLWRWTKSARKIYRSRARTAASKLHIPLLDITPEGELEKEIKDILEELGIMIYINKTHRDVLKQLITHVKHILDPHGEIAGKDGKVAKSRQRLGLSRKSSETNVTLLNMTKIPESDAKLTDGKDQVDTYDWFNINADEALTRVNDRIDQLEELQRIANDAASSVKDLLELKQQQAGVVQAWQSVRQSDEANAQGRAIMVFTIITIVFLPLSFMSSLFGMNTIEFGGDDNLMTLADQFRYIVGISAPVIFLTLVFSLNNWTRSALAALFRYSFLWLCARIGLYQSYLDVNLPSHNFHEDTMNATDELLDKQMKLYSQRRWQKFEKTAKEEEDAAALQSATGTLPNGSGSTQGSNRSNGGSDSGGHSEQGRKHWIHMHRRSARPIDVESG